MDKENLTATSQQCESTILPAADPCVLVIFGALGDLTKRLLFPSICNLGSNGLLNKNFFIVGVDKPELSDDVFYKTFEQNIETFITEPAAKKFAQRFLDNISYISGDFKDIEVYKKLNNQLIKLHSQKASLNTLFYFAVPPQLVDPIATGLNSVKLLNEQRGKYFRRLVIEKPFGHDLASAKALNQTLLNLVEEQQIFRIDHFLGKETVQNILAFRFSNGLFEPIWNHLYIDHVQITVAETLGVEERGAYYEHAGALRDMLPNHLFQMISLITMEPPASFESDHIQDEKEKALASIQFMTHEQVPQNTVRGQYGPGEINGQKVIGYRQEKNVDPHSNTETYVALRLFLDNWRWYKVPFYLCTGKRLAKKTSEILVQFKSGPSHLFTNCTDQIRPNILRIQIQPDEGISLSFNAKVPGPAMKLSPVNMSFRYSDFFGVKPATGYEIILYECMEGDHLVIKRAAAIETSWAIVQPILDVWDSTKATDFPNYAAGSWGPDSVYKLIQEDGRTWLP